MRPTERPVLLRVATAPVPDAGLQISKNYTDGGQTPEIRPAICLPNGALADPEPVPEAQLAAFYTEMISSLQMWNNGRGDNPTPGWRWLRACPQDPDWAMCCLPALPGEDRRRHLL